MLSTTCYRNCRCGLQRRINNRRRKGIKAMRQRRLRLLAISASLGALSSTAQTQVDLKLQAKDIDFSAASSTKTVQAGSTLPATCAQSQLFLLISAAPGQNLYVCTAANTWTLETGGGGGGAGLSGLTPNALVAASASNAIQTPNSGATIDSAGDINTPGTISSGSGVAGAGFVALPQGVMPAQSAFPTNSFSLVGNSTIAAQYQWVAPAADAAGLMASDGGGTPGRLSIKPLQGTDTNVLSAGTISGAGATLCTDANGGATTSGCSSSGGSSSYYVELGPLVGVDYNSNTTSLSRGWQTTTSGAAFVGSGTGTAPYDSLVFTESAATTDTLIGSTWLPPTIPSSVTMEMLAYANSEGSAFNIGFDLATVCTAHGTNSWKAPSYPSSTTSTVTGVPSEANYGYLLSWTVSLSSCSAGNTLWLKFDRNNSISGNLSDWVQVYDIRLHQ
jgi:hypothetical protein